MPTILANARSTRPRNAPIATATATTMIERRKVSSRVGHVTLRSSPTTSPIARILKARLATCELTLRVTPGSLATLSHLAMHCMLSTAWAELLQLQPLRIVPTVLTRVVRALSTVDTSKSDKDSHFSPAGHINNAPQHQTDSGGLLSLSVKSTMTRAGHLNSNVGQCPLLTFSQ